MLLVGGVVVLLGEVHSRDRGGPGAPPSATFKREKGSLFHALSAQARKFEFGCFGQILKIFRLLCWTTSCWWSLLVTMLMPAAGPMSAAGPAGSCTWVGPMPSGCCVHGHFAAAMQLVVVDEREWQLY
jgi:hypothetical protein